MMENTIVLLWGDHGWHLGDHGSWTKHSNFEQATHIPLIIYAPGVSQPGRSTQQLAETVDVYPTIADLAGLPRPQGPQPIDGVSLKSVLQDPELQIRDHAYHAFPRFGGKKIGCAIRTERYRMVEWIDMDPNEPNIYELYDYEEDPLETRNFAEEKPEVLQELKQILDRHPRAKAQVGRGF